MMIWENFAYLFSSLNAISLLYIAAGVFVGMLIGAIPGLTATTALILALPLTYTMPTGLAFQLLTAIYVGGISGGAVAAILLRIPGTPSSIATTFDGYPLAQQGRAGEALGYAFFASLVGTVFSGIILVAVAAPIAGVALRFGPPEYFLIIIVALASVVSLTGADPIRGYIAACIGFMLATVGQDEMSAVIRMTSQHSPFAGGFGMIPALIGLYGISELLGAKRSDASMKFTAEFGIAWPKWTVLARSKLNMLRSAVIGVGIGLIPAVGGNVSNLLSYSIAKSSSKDPESFGKGNPQGLIASETANNAVMGGAITPLLTLGIPGDGATAILFGALLLHGLQPGPLVFNGNPEAVYSIYGALFVGGIFVFAFGVLLSRVFAFALRTPRAVLTPLVVVLCVVGAYASDNSFNGVWTLLLFGIIGLACERANLPLAPLIIALILGPIAETNFRRSLTISSGDFGIFHSGPITLALLAAIALVVFVTVVRMIQRAIELKREASHS